MPPITALLHTANDALRLGRTLELLLPCAEILIVDHGSADATPRIAREYGARMLSADAHSAEHHYLDLARHDWILCIEPGESLSEPLQASLFEWRTLPNHTAIGASASAFSMFVREQNGTHWQKGPTPETRLVPRTWTLWRGRLPAPAPSAYTLEGDLLRFALP